MESYQQPLVGPRVVCVRGPSRSGKTTVVSKLVEHFERIGVRVAWVKRTHHVLDLPEKATGRVWATRPSAMVVHAVDRLQVTLPPAPDRLTALLAQVPPNVDLVLLETHEPEAYPTILSMELEPVPGEGVLRRWSLATLEADAAAAAEAIAALLPEDTELDHALRTAAVMHRGHVCAGLILGTRLALHGTRLLELTVPDEEKRLVVTAEIDRCALDAIASVTGCRPGKRTLRLLDYGKLAATFVDQRTGNAVRVATRGDLRERANAGAANHREAQIQAYLHWPALELFSSESVSAAIDDFDLPGPPKRRINCDVCGEEVSDGRDVATPEGVFCKPCHAAKVGWQAGGVDH